MQFFIISYFDFIFASTYNSILFCCLRSNVEPCCHTHDSRTTINVYNARPRLVGLALYTITDNRDCLQRVALGRPIPAVNRQLVAKCKIQTRLQQLLIAKYRDFSLPHLHSRPPLRRFPSEYCHDVWYRKTKMVWLPDGEKNFEDMFICFDRMYERDRHRDTT